jgi:transposase, IS6 family
VLAVRWYLRFGLSYRDVEELLTERGVQVDHVTIYRWVQRFTPLLADAARPCRHLVGDRWQVDEPSVKVAGQWPAAASNGRSVRRRSRRLRSPPIRRRWTGPCWRTCCRRRGIAPTGMPTTGSSADHGRLKARLGPMRGLNQGRSARVVIAGHAFVQNLRRGHDELAVQEPTNRRVAVAFDELVLAI